MGSHRQDAATHEGESLQTAEAVGDGAEVAAP